MAEELIGTDNEGREVETDQKELNELAEYLRILRNMLGLHAWELKVVMAVDIESIQPDHTILARCNVSYGRQHAMIEFAPEWKTWSQKELRDTCVHELLHCPFQSLTYVQQNVSHHLSPEMGAFLQSTWSDQLEIVVDQITNALTSFLPLMEETNASNS